MTIENWSNYRTIIVVIKVNNRYRIIYFIIAELSLVRVYLITYSSYAWIKIFWITSQNKDHFTLEMLGFFIRNLENCFLLVHFHISRVSCQKGPTCHAYAWQIGPFWQDTLDINSLWSIDAIQHQRLYHHWHVDAIDDLCPVRHLLLTWFNVNPSMDK